MSPIGWRTTADFLMRVSIVWTTISRNSRIRRRDMPASNPKVSADANTEGRELIYKRTFNAPREIVFAAWTDPKHVVQWWGLQGFSTTIQEMDVKPGGVWRLVMHGPDGRDYKNRIVFLE